jgi:WD40 repeat protein
MREASSQVAGADATAKTRVFLSYSRLDKAAADRLRDDLIARDIEVFQDVEDTLPGEEWWRRLMELIQQADTIVFLLSAHSSRSEVCGNEVAYATSLNKRIFPVVIESVDWSAVPAGLAKVHSIFLTDDADRAKALEDLTTALQVDIDWIRLHSRYLERAQAWDAQARPRSELLSGTALARAERWLVEQSPTAPPPTALHREYIQAGRTASTKRQRTWLAGSLTAAVVACGLALYAYFQKELAVDALTSQSATMAQASAAQARAGDTASAIQLALQALPKSIENPERPVVPAAISALSFALDQDRRVHALTTTGGSVAFAGYSPDGKLIASIPYDGEVQLWDAETGALVRNLGRHEDALHAAFSPDGRLLAVCSKDGKVWDVARGEIAYRLTGHKRSIVKVAFTPDGKRLVTTSADNTSGVWDAADGKPLTVLQGPEWSEGAIARDAHMGIADPIVRALAKSNFTLFGSMAEIAVGPDSRTAFIAGKFDPVGTPRLWNLDTGKETRAYPGVKVGIGFQFSDLDPTRDGSRLVGASGDNLARIWNTATGALIATLHGHTSSVESARFSPDGTRVVTSSFDNTARLWDGLTGRLIAILRGHANVVNKAVFSPDGSTIVTVSNDRSARLWDGVTGDAITVLHGHADSVLHAEFSPDGQRLLTSSRDGSVRLWRARVGVPVSEMRIDAGNADLFGTSADRDVRRRVTVSSNGKRALVERLLINIETGQILAEVDAGSGQFLAGDQVLLTDNLRLLSSETGVLIGTLPGTSAIVEDGGRHVLTVGENALHLFDAATAKPIADLDNEGESLVTVDFVRGGRDVVAVSQRAIRIWSVTSGKLVAHERRVDVEREKDLIATETGHVISLTRGGEVTITATDPMRHITPEANTGEEFEAIRLSPNGRWLVGLSRTGDVRVWSTIDGRSVLHSEAPIQQEPGLTLSMHGGADHGFAGLVTKSGVPAAGQTELERISFVGFDAGGVPAAQRPFPPRRSLRLAQSKPRASPFRWKRGGGPGTDTGRFSSRRSSGTVRIPMLSIDRLAQEYGLKDELDGAWAVPTTTE